MDDSAETNKRHGKRLETWSQIARIVTSAAAVAIAILTLLIYQRANEIAYRSNLPTIEARSTTDYTAGKCTETVTVASSGGTLGAFVGFPIAYMEVWYPDTGDTMYFELYGYFGAPELTGKSQVLPQTWFRENNRYCYELIATDFQEAASKDGYRTRMSLRIILDLSYVDYTGKAWHQYFEVGPFGSFETSWDYVKEIRRSAKIMESSEGYVFLAQTDGAKLWNWCKNEILTGD